MSPRDLIDVYAHKAYDQSEIDVLLSNEDTTDPTYWYIRGDDEPFYHQPTDAELAMLSYARQIYVQRENAKIMADCPAQERKAIPA